jgi:hypothetical protein
MAHLWLGQTALSDVGPVTAPIHGVERWCSTTSCGPSRARGAHPRASAAPRHFSSLANPHQSATLRRGFEYLLRNYLLREP